jgi:hypothetical protein
MLSSDEVMFVVFLERFVTVATEVFAGSEIFAIACIYVVRHPKTVKFDDVVFEDVVLKSIMTPTRESDSHPVRFKVDVELIVVSEPKGSQYRNWNDPVRSGKELLREIFNVHLE